MTKIGRADGSFTGEERIKQYYYHADHLESAQLITDADGQEYERIEYTPYGELWIEKASTASNIDIPYRFTGKERDEETGLYYYGARYLDSKTSRWLSTDPALGDYIPQAPVNDEAKKQNQNLPGMGGVFNTVNTHLYHYAGNNPVKYTDPDGRYSRANPRDRYSMMEGLVEGVGPGMGGGGGGGSRGSGGGAISAGAFFAVIGAMIKSAFQGGKKSDQSNSTTTGVDAVTGADPGPSTGADPGTAAGGAGQVPPPPSAGNVATAPDEPESPGRLNQEIRRGQAPRTVGSADSPRFPHEKPHVHFKDGNALNSDGTWKHGGRDLTNAEKSWLQSKGWQLPTE
jgi:RHS repeat-associated protein